MGYLDTWKTAKKNFEKVTGKKKPSEKWMGVFRKSTGMENAAKGLDEVLKKKGDEQALLTAEADYFAAMNSYGELLEKAARSEDPLYAAELKNLQAAMEKIALDFTKARTEARTDLFNALKKKAEALMICMDKALKECQADRRVADGQAADCDTALREVIDAVAKTDTNGAKAAAAKVGVAAKALVDLHKRVLSRHQKSQEVFRNEVRSWDVATFKGGHSPTQKFRDDADARVEAMSGLVETLAEYAAEGKTTAAEAVAALKGGANAEAVYVAGAQRLERRAIQAIATLDQTYRDIGGAIDKADLDRINGDEAKDPKEKERLRRGAAAVINVQKDRCKEIAKELSRNKKEIQRERGSFPATARDNPKLKPSLDEIDKALGFLEEITEGIAKEIDRIKKIEATLS